MRTMERLGIGKADGRNSDSFTERDRALAVLGWFTEQSVSNLTLLYEGAPLAVKGCPIVPKISLNGSVAP